jgi:hypothetical protein
VTHDFRIQNADITGLNIRRGSESSKNLNIFKISSIRTLERDYLFRIWIVSEKTSDIEGGLIRPETFNECFFKGSRIC